MMNKVAMQIGVNILKSTVDFVLPQRCPSCGDITNAGGPFCAACWNAMRFLSPPGCAACDVPLPFVESGGQICLNCIANPPRHDGIRAVVAYGDQSRQLALKLKYGGKIGLAVTIAEQLRRYLPDNSSGGDAPIFAVPVPLHWTRLWRRGFNQSALIAKTLVKLGNEKAEGLCFAPDMLVRTKRTPLLRGLSGAQRKKIVSKAFVIHPRWKDKVKGARILLIDDVYTSGATTDACVKELKKAGAQWVQIFCWARVLRDGLAIAEESFDLDT
jgi:ComF family protein